MKEKLDLIKRKRLLFLAFSVIFLLFFLAGCSNKEYINPDNYKCPDKTHIDCMPIVLEENIIYCEQNFRQWIEQNCKNVYFTD